MTIYLRGQPGESSSRVILSLFGLASGGVYPPERLLAQTVSSYLTLSPLPFRAVCFCCTFRRVTPPPVAEGTMLCEVRTFLSLAGAVTRPTPLRVWQSLTVSRWHYALCENCKLNSLQVIQLGRISYQDALDRQLEVLAQVQSGERTDTLLLLEHDPVLTLGASFHAENLLHPLEWYEEQGIQVLPTDRGGDITYHGPGQLVAYPIFDVAKHGKDLHRWMRELEEAVILALREFDIEGVRLPVNSGVWVEGKKICAIGIKIKRWVSMHGIAINCNTDLSPFSTIVPCGIRSHGVTSISQALGRVVIVEDFAPALLRGFQTVFPSA